MEIEVHDQSCECDFCQAAGREIRESFLEDTVAFLLKRSMEDAKGNQALGVALALKRAFRVGFKTGRTPETRPAGRFYNPH